MRPHSAAPILRSFLNLLVLSRKVSGYNKLRSWKWSGCASGVTRTKRHPFVSRLSYWLQLRGMILCSSCQFGAGRDMKTSKDQFRSVKTRHRDNRFSRIILSKIGQLFLSRRRNSKSMIFRVNFPIVPPSLLRRLTGRYDVAAQTLFPGVEARESNRNPNT
ncbi:hypothetical protein PUN28_018487 [Cardiocondyla obscurior]|uniref:Secreted protein n=1 Tax=Cardiocondyla obscurior TaxID=286306 RepID=A0AAW2EIH1_9HYME